METELRQLVVALLVALVQALYHWLRAQQTIKSLSSPLCPICDRERFPTAKAGSGGGRQPGEALKDPPGPEVP